MYFCSICLNMYENIEAANMCCSIELPQWKNDVNAHYEEKNERVK
jgi:hypothetical protein